MVISRIHVLVDKVEGTKSAVAYFAFKLRLPMPYAIHVLVC
jgi:hypothetical protein